MHAALALVLSAASPTPRHPLALPAQFEAQLTTTAHLVDGSLGYPPRHRRVHIWYDAPSGRARADVSEGFDAGKSFVRLYGAKREYMVRSGEFPTCQRAYLGDSMPDRAFPASAVYVGAATIDGVERDHWLVAKSLHCASSSSRARLRAASSRTRLPPARFRSSCRCTL